MLLSSDLLLQALTVFPAWDGVVDVRARGHDELRFRSRFEG